jgi:hypothetical protein
MSVGFAKVKVGLVCSEMKTLFEFILVEPVCANAVDGAGAGEGEGLGTGPEGLLFTGEAVDLHTDGCPEQV